MATTNQVREAHKLLDVWMRDKGLYADEVQMVRSLLPELPKQKTLAELIAHVDDAWAEASGYEWEGNSYDPFVSIEDWLDELRGQLEGLAEESAKGPVLPVGMRLAKHENHGLVVATGWIDSDNEHFCVYYDGVLERGSYVFLPESSLTFIDSKPAHPKFLETEADYAAAPEGTIVACEDSSPWHKFDSEWLSTAAFEGNSDKRMTGVIRRVLRWGWTNE